MLRSDRAMPLSVDVASELRDALGRRQKELPPRWLAALDAAALRDERLPVPGHALESVERALSLPLLERSVVDTAPRGIICVRASGSAASAALVEWLATTGSVTALAAVELEASLASGMVRRLVPATSRLTPVAIGCDSTLELPLPDRFPRPRVYLCPGNVLGSTTAVGAVRLLRVIRTTMSPGDVVVLGLDVPRRAHSVAETQENRHLRALELLDATLGAGLDPGQFEYRALYDAENDRIETHLVSRRARAVALPGVGEVRFRKGESIRTSLRCAFDRNRVSAMLAGVGLSLREWATDPESRFAVALAAPAT